MTMYKIKLRTKSIFFVESNEKTPINKFMDVMEWCVKL